MNASRPLRPLLVVAALFALAGCDGFKEQLGLTKQSPDEFRVVSRAPLSLPPDYSLVPPAPGAPRPQEGTATDQARTAVFGGDPGAQPLGTGASDQAFLSAAGFTSIPMICASIGGFTSLCSRSMRATENASSPDEQPADKIRSGPEARRLLRESSGRATSRMASSCLASRKK